MLLVGVRFGQILSGMWSISEVIRRRGVQRDARVDVCGARYPYTDNR